MRQPFIVPVCTHYFKRFIKLGTQIQAIFRSLGNIIFITIYYIQKYVTDKIVTQKPSYYALHVKNHVNMVWPAGNITTSQ